MKTKYLVGAVGILLVVVIAIVTLLLTEPEMRHSDKAEPSVASSKNAEAQTGQVTFQNGKKQSVSAATSVVADADAVKTPFVSPDAEGSSGAAKAATSVASTSQPKAGQRWTGRSAFVLNSPTAPQLPTGFVGMRDTAEILAGKDLSNPDERAQVVAEMSEMEEVRMNAVLAKAEEMGIPVRIEGPGHNVSILYDIREEGPLYRKTVNTNAAITTGANLLNVMPYNLTGTGMTVGVWDEARARTNHVELVGKVTIKDSTTKNSDHATHVAGTIAAKGVNAQARGMGTNTLINSYDWNNDYAEMTAAGAATATETSKLPASNHSYGYDAVNADMGRYEIEARSTDAVASGLPYYQIFWAAGNEQDVLTGLGGYQSITFNGLAKNVVTVGAVSKAVSAGLRDPSKSSIAYFSSMGPCDDGRIKPDVVADGVSVFSSIATTTNSYDTYSGTSMATPNAVGTSALLVQLYKANFSGKFMPASMLKGLLIHTADDLGRPGPDYQFGWGLINGKAAADLILAHKASAGAPKLIEGTITATNKVQDFSFAWDGTSPIRATLVWTDLPGVAQTASNSRTRNLINDLDLKITAPNGAASLPYVMPFVGTWTTASMTNNATTGTNKVDNVERVDIATPTQAGTYTVTVGMYGTNVLTGSQAYSLIVTGGADVPVNPPPVVTLISPTNDSVVLAGEAINLEATATDADISGNPGVVSKVEFFNGNTVIATDYTAPYTATWTPPGSGSYNISARATDSESAVGTSSTAQVVVMVGDGKPTISSFTPTSGTPGDIVTITGVNFTGTSSVKFNGTEAASFTVTSSTQITAAVPTGVSAGPISLVNAFGTAVSAGSFTVIESPVLISQIYGAGGNTGALFNADFVELYNRSENPVDVTGWSVQYASSTGTTWAVGALSGTIAPGKYYLIKMAGGASGSALPTPDATPATSINMSGTSGKVALRNSSTAISGSSPIGTPGLQDFVGYGTANSYRTAPAPSPSTTTSIFRLGGGATDTGNNAADFEAATPNPRNSTFGGVGVPVISSPLTASGTVGSLFSYQIVASNSPSSYASVGLPTGLSVNTSSGLISGTPTIAGTYNVTISATNGNGSDSKTLVITVNPSGGGGGSAVIFTENMGTPSGTTSIGANTFQNSGVLSFAGTGDVRITSASSGYTGASGSGNVFINQTIGLYFEISGINTTGYSDLALTFGHHKSSTAASNELAVEVSADGANYTQLTYSRPTGSGTANWMLISPTGTIPATANLRIRFRQTSTASQFRVDDVKLVGTSGSSAAITTSGTIAAVHTVYGTASPIPSSVTVSGAGMTEGILVTPPPGFEVSKTPGGASGYAATQTVGTSGAIGATDVFVRLAAGTSAGAYSGNLVCSSAGATSVSLAIPSSNVRKQNLSITANDQAKTFGQTLTLGVGQTAFTSSGLVLGQSIGTVTLTASGGTSASAASGMYDIAPSEATGGTFMAGNYEISYLHGTLTVMGQSYNDWAQGLPDTSKTADLDGDGLPNVLEYYMDLDPLVPDIGMWFSYEDGEMVLDYRRNKDMQGVTGDVEWIEKLNGNSGWTYDGVTEEILSDHGTYEIRRASVPMSEEDAQGFMRLHLNY